MWFCVTETNLMLTPKHHIYSEILPRHDVVHKRNIQKYYSIFEGVPISVLQLNWFAVCDLPH